MKLQKINENTFVLHGKLKDFSTYKEIKTLLQKIKNNGIGEVTFGIPLAKSINEHLLGYWLKLARKDSFKIHLYVQNTSLHHQLLNLGLHEFFKITDGILE
ncbi:MAG: hypothetical protein K2I63_04710 [Helicobacter sp.]|nr:hypothetical protein [Helicobacter sp.]